MHNCVYMLKVLLKNKMLIFWTICFPLILGTFFYMAFSDIENNEKFEKFNVAVVNNSEYQSNIVLVNTINELDKKMFDVTYVEDLDEGNKLLDVGDVIGVIDNFNVYVNENGIYQTILKKVIDDVLVIGDIYVNNGDYRAYYQDVLITDVSKDNLSYTMIEFYTLIAMACLYGGILSMVAINKSLPNTSSTGKRIGVSPTSSLSIILSHSLASFIIILGGIILLFLYTIFILNVNYGDHLLFVFLLALIGSFCGLSLGMFVGSVIKGSEDTKTGILISITMLGSFLSGMMGITMKYVVDSNLPIINKINPAALITDGFYSLYYYGVTLRYWQNLIILLIISVVLLIVGVLLLRRRKYECI